MTTRTTKTRKSWFRKAKKPIEKAQEEGLVIEAPKVSSAYQGYATVATFDELEAIANNQKKVEGKELLFQQQLYLLLKAIQNNQIEEIKKALSFNPLLANGVYQNKYTPLYVAVSVGDFDCVMTILDAGANVNIMLNERNEDICWEIVRENKLEFLDAVLDRVKEINRVDIDEQSRLVQAVKLSNYSATEAYLLRGINVNQQDKEGKTALHWNLFRRDFKEEDERIFRLLLGAGASYEIKDRQGLKPYEYASLYDPTLARIATLAKEKFYILPEYAVAVNAEYDRVFPLPKSEDLLPDSISMGKSISRAIVPSVRL